MKVLFSSQATIEYDGKDYYSNAIPDTYTRYQVLGKDITLLCHARKVEKAKSQRINPEDITIIPIPKYNSVKSMLFETSKTEEIVKEEVRKADVCFIHLGSNHGYMAVKYAKKYHKPYMTVICGCTWDSLWNYDWRGKIMAPRAFLKLRYAQHDAPWSIYVTKEFLQRRYPTSGKWIACSNVDISTGQPGVLEKRLENIKKRQSAGRLLRIGTAAAVDVPYKGQEYVIRAVAQLKSMGINMEYNMIGLGDSSRLQSIINSLEVGDRVHILGGLPHDKVTEFYDDIDIYVQPSKQEGLPRSTIEAMSRGCLCLGSAIAGIPELLTSEYLFPKGRVDRIVEILKNIKPEDLTAQARRNFEEAKDYDRDLLNERRRQFILDFKESIVHHS